MIEKEIAVYHDNGRGFKGPILKLTISEEFVKQLHSDLKEVPYLGTFLIDDALDCTVGPYKIELRFWNKKEEDERKEWNAYMNDRGYALERRYEEMEYEQIQEQQEDFKRWKEERQKI